MNYGKVKMKININKFNINKFGIAWTTAFIMWNLAFVLEGDDVCIHVVSMILQTLLLFVFLWCFVAKKRHDIFMEEWRKEMEDYKKEFSKYI